MLFAIDLRDMIFQGLRSCHIKNCVEQDKSSDIEQRYHSATLNKAIHSLKIGGLQNQWEHHTILTKNEAVHPTAVSENNSSRRVKGDANFISSGSKIVKRFRRRQYDPVIIERTIGLVFGPFTALYRYDGPCLNLLRGDRVLIPVPSVC